VNGFELLEHIEDAFGRAGIEIFELDVYARVRLRLAGITLEVFYQGLVKFN